MHSKTLTLRSHTCECVCVCVKEQDSTKNTTSSRYLVHARMLWRSSGVRAWFGLGPGMDRPRRTRSFVHQDDFHTADEKMCVWVWCVTSLSSKPIYTYTETTDHITVFGFDLDAKLCGKHITSTNSCSKYKVFTPLTHNVCQLKTSVHSTHKHTHIYIERCAYQ